MQIKNNFTPLIGISCLLIVYFCAIFLFRKGYDPTDSPYIRGYHYRSVQSSSKNKEAAKELPSGEACVRGLIYPTNMLVEGMIVRLNLDYNKFWTQPGVVCSNRFIIKIPPQEYTITGLAIKVPDYLPKLRSLGGIDDVTDSGILGVKLSSSNNVHILPPIILSQKGQRGVFRLRQDKSIERE